MDDTNELDFEREVQVLRAHRRLSTSHPAAIDPDFPSVQSPHDSASLSAMNVLERPSTSLSSGVSAISPPLTPKNQSRSFDEKLLSECSPIFGSSNRERYLARRQMRHAQAASAPRTPEESWLGSTPSSSSASHTPHPLPTPPLQPSITSMSHANEMWIPASKHSEVSADEFRTFLKEQAARNVSHYSPWSTVSSSSSPSGSPSRQVPLATSLARRSSSLRRQVRQEDRTPASNSGAGTVHHKRSFSNTESPLEHEHGHEHGQTIIRTESLPSRYSREFTSRSHRKPPPSLVPVDRAELTGQAPNKLSSSHSSSLPAPMPVSLPASHTAEISRAQDSADHEKTLHAMRALLPQKGDLPELPPDATAQLPSHTQSAQAGTFGHSVSMPSLGLAQTPLIPHPPQHQLQLHAPTLAQTQASPLSTLASTETGAQLIPPPPPPRRQPSDAPDMIRSASGRGRFEEVGRSTTNELDKALAVSASPSRQSDEKNTRFNRKSDEMSRLSLPSLRDRKTFGLSWFGLSKDDDESRVRKKEKEAKEDCASSAPTTTSSSSSRREKDTFLTGLFSKRKGQESYDTLRNRARNLFTSSSSSSTSSASGQGAASSPSSPGSGTGIQPGAAEFAIVKRYPPPVERALYRLSHVKLSNPRRPLYQQVIVSNFMFWYLSIINSAQARPERPSSTVNGNRGDGLSEYDERNKLYKQGTGPRSPHTGTFLFTLPTKSVSPPMYVPGALVTSPWIPPAPQTVWSLAPLTEPPLYGGVPTAPMTPPPTTKDDQFLPNVYSSTALAHESLLPVSEMYMTSPTSTMSGGMPRSARGPLPNVPSTPPPAPASGAGTSAPKPPPRSARRIAHLERISSHAQEEAPPAQHGLRHARSSPSLSKSARVPSHPLPLPPLPVPLPLKNTHAL